MRTRTLLLTWGRSDHQLDFHGMQMEMAKNKRSLREPSQKCHATANTCHLRSLANPKLR